MESIAQICLLGVTNSMQIMQKKYSMQKNPAEILCQEIWQYQRRFFWNNSQKKRPLQYYEAFLPLFHGLWSIQTRVRPRFFDQVGHETMYASSRKKHFSLNYVIVRLTKIMNILFEVHRTYQNSYFQSHFSVLKIGWMFPKKNLYEEYWARRPTFIKKCFWKFWFLKYFIF